MIRIIYIMCLLSLLPSCIDNNKVDQLSLSNDELVHALVEIYTLQAAQNLNDLVYRDSMANIYYAIVAQNIGRPVELIRKDFEKLVNMPDSMVVLQSRALDTLRHLQDSRYSQSNISIGIN